MKFYCVVRSMTDRRFPKRAFALLSDACKKRKVQLIPVEAEKFDFSNPPKLGKGDMLYRITTDERSRNVAGQLLNDNVASFFIDDSKKVMAESWRATLTHQKFGLPIIPTIVDLPKDKKVLDKYVEKLGGYPIIIKVQGGSHGVGIIRADSAPSLYSIVDYLRTLNSDAGLRKYIEFSAHARLIVLGDKVIDSIEYIAPENDFRSNVGSRPQVKVKKFSPAVEKAAVEATHVLGHDFGGVDILIDKNGQDFYLAEVNFPCNFARSQDLTGTDIAGMMIDYLMAKAKVKIGN